MPMPDWRLGGGLEDGHIIRSDRLQFIASNGCEFAPQRFTRTPRPVMRGVERVLSDVAAFARRITRLERWQQGH